MTELRPSKQRQTKALAEIVAATPVDRSWADELTAMRATERETGDEPE